MFKSSPCCLLSEDSICNPLLSLAVSSLKSVYIYQSGVDISVIKKLLSLFKASTIEKVLSSSCVSQAVCCQHSGVESYIDETSLNDSAD